MKATYQRDSTGAAVSLKCQFFEPGRLTRCCEIVISVGNERLIPENVRVFLESAMEEADSCVSRPTNPKEEYALPTTYFFENRWWRSGLLARAKLQNFMCSWADSFGSDIPVIRGGIDEEVLRPKLLNVIREAVARQDTHS